MSNDSNALTPSITRVFGGTNRFGLVATIIVDIVLPWLAVRALAAHGVAAVPAFAVAAVFPLASILFSWIARRRIEIIGVAVVATMLSGIAVSAVSGDPRFSILKAAPAYGLFGLACLLSLFTARPLMFFVARYFGASGDRDRTAEWDARLQIPKFRAAMRRLTVVWGVAALAEAALGFAAAFGLPPQLALIAEPMLGFATVAALLVWTAAFARRATQG